MKTMHLILRGLILRGEVEMGSRGASSYSSKTLSLMAEGFLNDHKFNGTGKTVLVNRVKEGIEESKKTIYSLEREITSRTVSEKKKEKLRRELAMERGYLKNYLEKRWEALEELGWL